jgi:hypothetical protein
LTWGLSAVFSFLFALIAALPIFLLLLPAARGMLADGWSSATIGALTALAIYGVLLGVGVGGIFTSFNVIVWSLLFRRFRDADDGIAIT